MESQILEPVGKPRHKSIIMIHGFGDSPLSFKQLAKELSEMGYFVSVPLVPCQTRNSFSYFRGRFESEHYREWIDLPLYYVVTWC